METQSFCAEVYVTIDLNTCPRCGQDNSCVLNMAEKTTCWCMSVPIQLTVPTDPLTSCYCRTCLLEVTDE
ncbi:MAG: hypothetical protein EOP10_07845 [Proteobacteria bacterium]|nr:MAG: hypothetical protein EOP10_07845 [Pseudomonadota bacterium]